MGVLYSAVMISLCSWCFFYFYVVELIKSDVKVRLRAGDHDGSSCANNKNFEPPAIDA